MPMQLRFRRLPSEPGWILASPKVCVDSRDIGIEIVIRTGDGEPAPAFRALIERGLPELHALVGRAKRYLDSFIERQRLVTGSERIVEAGRHLPDAEWYFDGIEAGAPGDAATDLWLQFSLETDLYGRWMVRVREEKQDLGTGWRPVEFRRVQD